MAQPNYNVIFPRLQGKVGVPIRVKDPSEELIKRYDRQTNLIIGVLVVALGTMIIMTATLIVDSFHINSTVYKEYSEKIETLNDLQKTNQEQLEIIKSYQETIKSLLKP